MKNLKESFNNYLDVFAIFGVMVYFMNSIAFGYIIYYIFNLSIVSFFISSFLIFMVYLIYLKVILYKKYKFNLTFATLINSLVSEISLLKWLLLLMLFQIIIFSVIVSIVFFVISFFFSFTSTTGTILFVIALATLISRKNIKIKEKNKVNNNDL